MKKRYVLIDRKIWDGDAEYDQLLGIVEDNPKVLLDTKIEGVVVLTEAEFNRQFNKGRISPRRYELFIVEV